MNRDLLVFCYFKGFLNKAEYTQINFIQRFFKEVLKNKNVEYLQSVFLFRCLEVLHCKLPWQDLIGLTLTSITFTHTQFFIHAFEAAFFNFFMKNIKEFT